MKLPQYEALAQLEKFLEDHAHSAMSTSNGDPFHHGVQVGLYQGTQRAIQIINNAISAGDDAEAKL